ncbi:MAG: hypothetical protein HY093_03120 [Candidatus Liptonbacteria bacterium]|nr:hypothetical protein [Candidatus Liptonbacteria bacterium]
MKKFIIGIPITALVFALFAAATPALAGQPGFVFPGGCCFYNGASVRTVVPPAAFPNEGTDNFYAIGGGAVGQKAIVAVAPGDIGYHGGHWAFYGVTWNVTPYLLTSETAVLAAESAGDVTVTRDPSKDFLCPIQP